MPTAESYRPAHCREAVLARAGVDPLSAPLEEMLAAGAESIDAVRCFSSTDA
jgi:hypothetical protein